MASPLLLLLLLLLLDADEDEEAEVVWTYSSAIALQFSVPTTLVENAPLSWSFKTVVKNAGLSTCSEVSLEEIKEP